MPTTMNFVRRHWKRLAVDVCMCAHIMVMSSVRFDGLLQSRVCLNLPEAAGSSYPCSLLSLGVVARVTSLLIRLPETIIAHAAALNPSGRVSAPQELWNFITLSASSLTMCMIIAFPKFYIQHARSWMWLIGNICTVTAAFSSLILFPRHPASLYQTRYLNFTGPGLIWQQIVLQVCTQTH